MKFILTFLSLGLLLAPVVWAAPSANLSLTKDKRFVYLTFRDLASVARVNYTLVYDTSRGQKGFEGGFKLRPKTTRASRRQILGTCSGRKCVYHAGVKNVQLDAFFNLRSGGSTRLHRRLP